VHCDVLNQTAHDHDKNGRQRQTGQMGKFSSSAHAESGATDRAYLGRGRKMKRGNGRRRGRHADRNERRQTRDIGVRELEIEGREGTIEFLSGSRCGRSQRRDGNLNPGTDVREEQLQKDIHRDCADDSTITFRFDDRLVFRLRTVPKEPFGRGDSGHFSDEQRTQGVCKA